MQAEVILLDPNDVSSGKTALNLRGFKVEVLDWIDDDGPAFWIKARISTELDELSFFRWVKNIVSPSHGDVVEAGAIGPRPTEYRN